jgi:hypothetical protein
VIVLFIIIIIIIIIGLTPVSPLGRGIGGGLAAVCPK